MGVKAGRGRPETMCHRGGGDDLKPCVIPPLVLAHELPHLVCNAQIQQQLQRAVASPHAREAARASERRWGWWAEERY